MSRALRILLVEDSEDDAFLVKRELERFGFTLTSMRVDTKEGMVHALNSAAWDVILGDYSMPHFNGMAALELLREWDPDVPFILISGTIGEETAVQAMKAGAQDYIMKDNLVRLGVAIERGLQDAEERRARRHAEERLRESEEHHRILTEAVADAIISIDEESTILFANPAVEALFGYDSAELIGQKLTMLMPERMRPVHLAALKRYRQTRKRNMSWKDIELPGLHKDGRELPLEISFGEYTKNGKSMMVGVLRDITAHKLAEEHLTQNAYYDALTGLPNRTLFMDLLKRSIARASQEPEFVFAVLFVDVDGLKRINDDYGHLVGDKLLIEVGAALRKTLRPGDIAARFGGDEFVVLLFNVHDSDEAQSIAARIQQVVAEPITLKVTGEMLHASASIGMALSSMEYTTADDLLRKADESMYATKAAGKHKSRILHHPHPEKAGKSGAPRKKTRRDD